MLSQLEWLVLDSTSDDWESPPQIISYVQKQLPSVMLRDLNIEIYAMLSRGLLTQMELMPITEDQLQNLNPEHPDAQFWFGMSSIGVEAWEKDASLYKSAVDWSRAWTFRVNYVDSSGYCEGVSEAVCREALTNQSRFSDVEILVNTIKVAKLSSFSPKYYKTLTGGVRLDFKIRRKPSPL